MGHRQSVEPIDRYIRRSGSFQRRRDLLARGYVDRGIRAALSARTIFRVRQGWYSVPDAPAQAIRAIRVGGELTGISALESYGLLVPRRSRIDVAVPRNANRLRKPDVRYERLAHDDGFDVHWVTEQRGSRRTWRVTVADALLHILSTESRDIAVACASSVMHKRRLSQSELEDVFARAPLGAQPWLGLVSPLDESHGETFVRLWLLDVGIVMVQQVRIAGVGRIDGRVSRRVFLEVDGAQHDPGWVGEEASGYIADNFRDLHMRGVRNTVIRIIYPVLYGAWEECLQGIRMAIATDEELDARRERHPEPRRFRVSRRARPA